MKYLVQTVLLIFLCFGCSILKRKKTVFTCDEGIKDAIIKAQKGEYLLISYGLTFSIDIVGYSDYGFNDFRDKFIYDKYGIKYEDGGCVITQYGNCYREKTEELLFEKYGNDIFSHAEKEAIKLFKETDNYKDSLKNKIESNHVFPSFITHKRPNFIGGEKKLEAYLGKSTNIYAFDWDKEYIDVDFIIEKDGDISNIEINSSIKNKDLEPELKTEILKLMEKMPAWKPAIYFGEKVRVSESINIAIQ